MLTYEETTRLQILRQRREEREREKRREKRRAIEARAERAERRERLREQTGGKENLEVEGAEERVPRRWMMP